MLGILLGPELGVELGCSLGFVLGLLLLSFMQINPWTLLVSMTSLLVSVSFALGPSVSKYVEVSSIGHEARALTSFAWDV